MAGLRAFSCYRKPKRAYTRKSKYKKKGYIKSVPNIKIVKFDLGDLKTEFAAQVDLVSKERIQIRHNALESARQVVVRKLGKTGKPYHFKIRVFPHNVIRENKMLTGAGADRMQTGMQRAFGKAIGSAAVLKPGQAIFTLYVHKEDVEAVKPALKAAMPKLPCKCGVLEVKK
jgi:large subunit ribosomal protein L10e